MFLDSAKRTFDPRQRRFQRNDERQQTTATIPANIISNRIMQRSCTGLQSAISSNRQWILPPWLGCLSACPHLLIQLFHPSVTAAASLADLEVTRHNLPSSLQFLRHSPLFFTLFLDVRCFILMQIIDSVYFITRSRYLEYSLISKLTQSESGWWNFHYNWWWRRRKSQGFMFLAEIEIQICSTG